MLTSMKGGELRSPYRSPEPDGLESRGQVLESSLDCHRWGPTARRGRAEGRRRSRADTALPSAHMRGDLYA
jgi:hypothetical protein